MKKGEFLKLGLASTVVIGIFSLLFVKAQRFIMEGSQKEETIPHQLESVQLPLITGIDLRKEEAVELATMYLIAILGEDLENASIEALFEVLGPWWEIYIRKEGEIIYRLDMDHNSGKLLLFINSAYRNQLKELHGPVSLSGPITPDDFLPIEEMETFYELAKNFAWARINAPSITHIELISDSDFLWDLNDVVVDQHLSFLATDVLGRQVMIIVSRKLQTLIELQVIEPDFFPNAFEKY